MSENTINLTDKDFDAQTKKGKWVIDFWADWCGPCKIIAPYFDAAAGEMKGKVNFAKVDVDKESGLSEKFEILSIPTLMFIKDGEIVDIVNGVISKDELVKRAKEI